MQEKVVDEAQRDDRFLLKSIDFLPHYDDLMIQIDDDIVEYTGDKKCSVGVRAAIKVEQYGGRAFFHCNYPACLRLERYIRMLTEMQVEQEIIDELRKGVDHLWDCALMYQHVPMNKTITIGWHPSTSSS